MSLRIETFGDRRICIGGIGRMYYQDGLPISISIAELKRRNIEVSMLHIADELLKNGWSAERVVLTMQAQAEDDIDKVMDVSQIHAFCWNTYEGQRQMIFDYLFGNKENARAWADKNIFK